MSLRGLKNLLDRWTLSAVSRRLDKRALQQELDDHRLYLLTGYYERAGRRGEPAGPGDAAAARTPGLTDVEAERLAEELSSKAAALGRDGLREAVDARLQSQARVALEALRASLGDGGGEASRALEAPSPGASSGGGPRISFLGSRAAARAAVEPTAPEPAAPAVDGEPRPAPSWEAIRASLRASMGFSLRAAPSTIATAGRGLFVAGSARAGQLVALYPGVAYGPLQYRRMPGYPKVDRESEALIGRFDGVVLDAAAWGVGRPDDPAAPGSSAAPGSAVPGSPPPPPSAAGWPAKTRTAAEGALARLEGRNGLALAHLANHPPAGTRPNVVLAPLDLEAPGGNRAFVPVVVDGGSDAVDLGEPRLTPTLALVALRDIEDEEVFLNYRLNPSFPSHPPWYSPVDEEEDARRWA